MPGLRRVEHPRSRRRGAPPPPARRGGRRGAPAGRAVEPVTARRGRGAERSPRLKTGIGELDRVLGGGLVPGSLVLIGGSPGIGKSTLTLDGARQPRGRRPAHALRLRRGVGGADQAARRAAARRARSQVPVVAETDLDAVLATLEAERPEVCVIDSVQTLHAAELTGAAGSVGQVREVADRIMRLAKARGIAVLLVGHVTKEGALAGPRVLEHLVDCVLQFEGERERTYRTLRALKNRFGSTNEVGVFEMRRRRARRGARRLGALRRRGHARARQRRARARWRARGRCWSRCRRSSSPSELVPPRRVANGIDRNRLALVLAVLARHAGVGVGQRRRVRQRRRRRARRRAGRRPRGRAGGGERRARRRRAATASGPLACFGELGLTGELRSVGAPRPAPGRGAQVRPRSR